MKSAILTLAALAALAWGSIGCLVIPMNYDSGAARTNVNDHVQKQFTAGQNLREDVLLTLGEPDAISRDERNLAYRSEKVAAWWIMAWGTAAPGPGAEGVMVWVGKRTEDERRVCDSL